MHASPSESGLREGLRSNKEFLALTKVLEDSFPKLKFPEPFESEYSSHRFEILKARAVVVAWCGLCLNIAYIISDFLLLPDLIYPLTVAIRVAVTAPVILFLVLMNRLNFTEFSFMSFYMSLYLVGGIAVIAISVIVRVNDVAIPYEGVLLIMMFGYLVMAIPFRLALAGAGVLFLIYSLAEVFLGYSSWVLIYNLFFILTANVIGAVGCYIQERSDRRNYINDRLLQLARDSAQQQSVLKSNLIAEASHDLRQPLHAMTLLVEAMSSRHVDEEHDALTARLQSSLLHLSQLLGAMFDMSKLEIGLISPKLQALELVQLLKQVYGELAPTRSVQIKLNCDELEYGEVFVETDPILLARMLRNLLENAQVHARAKSIEFGIKQDLENGGSEFIKIYVQDDGKGMPDINDPGASDLGRKRRDGVGLGLGLSIVRNLADILNIGFDMESELGRGTRFELTVPITVVEPDEAPEIDSDEASFAKKKVLLVDNDDAILESASKLLLHWGYEVQTLAQPVDVIPYLRQEPLDLVISDFHFDRGQSAACLIGELENEFPELPFILLTADTQIKMDDFSHPGLTLFYKPIAPAKLRAALIRKL